jgi:phosphoenolpyruvate carboxykinase (GTP)
MASERTAAQAGVVGEVRRDPMAMLPFCGYNMGDYFQHWLNMGHRMSTPPKIFRVNWFRKDENGNYIWPGFGENIRVLIWMVKRSRYQVAAHHTPLGYIPYKPDFDWRGLSMTDENWEKMFQINPEEWNQELDSQKDFFKSFGNHFPQELYEENEFLRGRITPLLKNHINGGA